MYDASKPGARLTNITVNGKPLNDRANYTLTTTSYVAIDGGDGYSMFKGAKLLVPIDQSPSESDILQKAISSVPAIAPKVDERIVRTDTAKDSRQCP
jgi:5'-nucleotidase